MNEDILLRLKHLLEGGACKHERTHPGRCDDCGAEYCLRCSRYHQGHIDARCEFSRLLLNNAKGLIELASSSQRAVQEFIDYHHNPIVSRLLVENEQLKAELKEANEFSEVLKGVMKGYQRVMGLE